MVKNRMIAHTLMVFPASKPYREVSINRTSLPFPLTILISDFAGTSGCCPEEILGDIVCELDL